MGKKRIEEMNNIVNSEPLTHNSQLSIDPALARGLNYYTGIIFENESKAAFALMQELRNTNIRCELYHEQAKFNKQFKYDEKKNILYVVIIGDKEVNDKTCTIKNLLQGSQKTIPQQELLSFKF